MGELSNTQHMTGADPMGWFKPPLRNFAILFRGFLMNWLQTEGQTVPNMPWITGKSLRKSKIPPGRASPRQWPNIVPVD